MRSWQPERRAFSAPRTPAEREHTAQPHRRRRRGGVGRRTPRDVETAGAGGVDREIAHPAAELLLGVLRFKTKLKRKAASRLAKVQYQKVDLVKSAPLSVIVALSLKAQRAQAKTKSSEADDASKAVRGAPTACRQALSVT